MHRRADRAPKLSGAPRAGPALRFGQQRRGAPAVVDAVEEAEESQRLGADLVVAAIADCRDPADCLAAADRDEQRELRVAMPGVPGGIEEGVDLAPQRGDVARIAAVERRRRRDEARPVGAPGGRQR